MRNCLYCIFVLVVVSGFSACTGKQTQIHIEQSSVAPGERVKKGEKQFELLGNPIALGMQLPSVELVDAQTMALRDLSKDRGNVLLLSIVPSIDTKVCETQTHYLGEEGDALPEGIERIVISRDTPFAQKRFAEAAKLSDLTYLSDYKEGAFGRSLGLLVENIRLLARSVVIVDRQGVVRYIQVVPEITHLPDMEAAFDRAKLLLKE